MDIISILLALVAILLAVMYYLHKKNKDITAEYGIPFYPSVPILGSLWQAFMRRNSFAEIINTIYKYHPKAKYVGLFDFMTPMIMLRDPDLIKSIAIKNFEHFTDHRNFVKDTDDPLFGKNLFALRGDRWKEVRAMLSPAFTTSKMRSMFKLMSECAAHFGDYMAALPDGKNVLEMKDAFSRYTNDVIATCAFGVHVDSMRDRDNTFLMYGKEATSFTTGSNLKFIIVRSLPLVARLLNITLVNKKIALFFKELVGNTVKTRDEQGINRPDMIQLMMESRGKFGGDKELTIDDMTAQAFLFFFGGFDSTSTLMCFAAHEIAVNRDVHERLQNEVDEVLEKTGGEMTYEAVNEMKYLDAILNEALRMYPVAIAADRECVKRFELPPAVPEGKPYIVEQGSYLWLPIYGLQHDPQYFDEPEKFNPDRFIDDSKKIANSGAYLPFGLGPRMCIGNRFALLETKALLCHLLARCDLVPCSKTMQPMKLSKKGFAVTAEDGFWLEIKPRKNPPFPVKSPVGNQDS